MDDKQIQAHIETLIEEEHKLLEHGDRGKLTAIDQTRLDEIQVRLDQFWDLLRQRRARRDAGQDPNTAHLRGENVVEKYQQ